MSPSRQTYRHLAKRLRKHDRAIVDEITDMMTRAGLRRPTRATVLRLSMEFYIDSLHDESDKEFVRLLFQARRTVRKAPAPTVH